MAGSNDFTPLFQAAGAANNIDPDWLAAINQVESAGDSQAVSSSGAQGNMQLMPATAAALGVQNPQDPAQAIPGAAQLLAQNLAKFKDPRLATAAYFGGDDESKWGPNTLAYVPKVAAAYEQIKAGKMTQQPAPAASNDDESLVNSFIASQASGAPSAGTAPSVAPNDEALVSSFMAPPAPASGNSGPAAPTQYLGYSGRGKKDAMPSLPSYQDALSFANNAIDSATFGADRIIAPTLDAPLVAAAKGESLPAAFSDVQNSMAASRGVLQSDNPVAADAAQVAGAVASPVNALLGPLYATARAPTVAGRVLNAGRNMLLNSAAGAAYAGGTANGDAADHVEAAGIGALAAPVVGAVGAGVSGLARPAASQAANMLTGAAAADNLTPEALIANMKALGPNATVADAGGANVTGLAGAIANQPGPASEIAHSVLEGRAAEQPARLTDAVQAATGQTGAVHDMAAQLMAERAGAAAPLYQSAFSRIVPTTEEAAQVAPFIQDSIGQKAMNDGLRVIQLESLAKGQPFNPADFGVTQDPETGKFTLAAGVPNLRLMDAVKRGYDGIVESYRDPVTQKLNLDQFGNAVNQVRAAYTGTLRSMYPRYASALDAWAGPSQALDALSLGRRALSNDPEVTAKAVAGLPDSQKQFFLAGVTRALTDKIDGTADGANAIRGIFGNQKVRDKVAAAFDNPDAFNQFAQTMQQEAQFSATRNAVLKNSPTAARLAAQQAFQPVNGPEILGHIASAIHNPVAYGINAVAKRGAAALSLPSATASAELGRLLFTPGGSPDLQNLLLQGAKRTKSPAVPNALLSLIPQPQPTAPVNP